ncbi:MAG TPA: gamma carbonic anhydrase family protein [Clostridia bacterium]|nr:gamma carbonic anhydrase family protein [Clostridia bacterium]
MDIETQLRKFLLKTPTLGQGAYIAPGAVVVGDVTLGNHSSVWFNAVLRGDLNRIVVGSHTNIQDNCVVHLADDLPCVLGDHVTVGHSAVLHGCTVANGALIGMRSTLLDGAKVGEESLVGAASLVTEGMEIPAGWLAMGSPAVPVRPLSAEERQWLRSIAEKYVRTAEFYAAHAIGRTALCEPQPG